MNKLIQLLKDEHHAAYTPAYTAFSEYVRTHPEYVADKTYHLRLRDVGFGSTVVYQNEGDHTVWACCADVAEEGWVILLRGGDGQYLGLMDFLDEQGAKPDFSNFMIGRLTDLVATKVPGSMQAETAFVPSDEFVGDMAEIIEGINAALFEEHYRQTKSFRGLEALMVRSAVAFWQAKGSKAFPNENRSLEFAITISAWESALSNLSVDELVAETADETDHEDA